MQTRSIPILAAAAAALSLVGCVAHRPTGTTTAVTPVTTLSQPDAPADVRQVSFKTSDGWTIVGDLYVPKGEPKGAVVLLHQRGGKASDWAPLSTALQKAGIEALAIDQRGAG